MDWCPPNASSIVNDSPNSILLIDLIESYLKEILDEVVTLQFGKRLPFLFKVLPVVEAPSIQAYPKNTCF